MSESLTPPPKEKPKEQERPSFSLNCRVVRDYSGTTWNATYVMLSYPVSGEDERKLKLAREDGITHIIFNKIQFSVERWYRDFSDGEEGASLKILGHQTADESIRMLTDTGWEIISQTDLDISGPDSVPLWSEVWSEVISIMNSDGLAALFRHNFKRPVTAKQLGVSDWLYEKRIATLNQKLKLLRRHMRQKKREAKSHRP